jgi:predicted RNA binding protein YcfA (HicA-like mRNA interferase family)
MHSDLPAITGKQLIRLLEGNGWLAGRKANHGRTMTKRIGNRTRVTFIPETKAPLPKGTLMSILGSKQTAIGREGLIKLIKKK